MKVSNKILSTLLPKIGLQLHWSSSRKARKLENIENMEYGKKIVRSVKQRKNVKQRTRKVRKVKEGEQNHDKANSTRFFSLHWFAKSLNTWSVGRSFTFLLDKNYTPFMNWLWWYGMSPSEVSMLCMEEWKRSKTQNSLWFENWNANFISFFVFSSFWQCCQFFVFT